MAARREVLVERRLNPEISGRQPDQSREIAEFEYRGDRGCRSRPQFISTFQSRGRIMPNGDSVQDTEGDVILKAYADAVKSSFQVFVANCANGTVTAENENMFARAIQICRGSRDLALIVFKAPLRTVQSPIGP